MDDPNENSPTVVAYRVGRLEKAVEKGFANTTKQLEDFAKGFVTRGEFDEKALSSNKEHKEIWDAIKGIKTATRWWVTTIILFLTALGTFIWALHG